MINRTLGPQSWREYIVFGWEGVKFNAEMALTRFSRKNVVTDEDLNSIVARAREKRGGDLLISGKTLDDARDAYRSLTRNR